MKYFKLLNKKSNTFFAFLVLLGLMDSVWVTTLIAFIDTKITGNPLPISIVEEYDAAFYVFAMILSFIVSRYFQSHMVKLTCNFGTDLALSIFDKLRFTNYNEFQELGQDRVRTLMSDVGTIQRFPTTFIEVFKAGVMTLIGVSYMFYTHLFAALILSSVILVLTFIFYFRNLSIENDIEKLRDLQNTNEKHTNNFLRGFKEIKTSITRSGNIFQYISDIKNSIKLLNIKVLSKYIINELLASHAVYMVIGVILFLLPMIMNIQTSVITSFIMIIFFLTGPLTILVSEIEEFTRMNTAYKRIDEFNRIINSSESTNIGYGDLTNINESFENLEFENLIYEYFDKKKNSTFVLGPINLKISKGECIFITGGNGSGKSTFINLLTGLYVPISGNIHLNGTKINAENYPYYRDQIASVFTDTYLFDENYNGFEINPINIELNDLVNEMKISNILKIDEDKQVFNLTLSKGQQKRLALIYALMEKKDIIVLDEWAAEQDPKFRSYFYNVLIQKIKESGKTLIAVTHDDEYFNCAERLIEFKYGKVYKDLTISELKEVEV